MKNCMDCKYAEWERTAAGKLHPSGGGKCTFKYKLPPLPACMYWCGLSEPKPSGWHINRREELKEHCAYYSKQAD